MVRMGRRQHRVSGRGEKRAWAQRERSKAGECHKEGLAVELGGDLHSFFLSKEELGDA